MSFDRPTLSTLIERAVADVNARMPGADARLRASNLAVLARVHAGAVHGLYGYLSWIARQVIVDTAEAEYLERWSTVWGIVRLSAAAATGNVTFTGGNGVVVPSGTLVQRADAAQYRTTAEGTVSAGTVTVAAQAVAAGAAGAAEAATALALVVPVVGLDSAATVAAGGMTGGADAETDDALRARLLARIQSPPHGGAAHDYIAWALEVPGVTRAWVYPLELGAGTVSVRFVRDDDVSPIPDAGEVAAVQAHIDALRPVTAAVTVVAPVAVPLAVTLTTLSPNTAAVRAAIQAELADLLRREAEPGGTVLLSHIREAISIAAGEDNYVMSLPAADVTHTTGQIATLGTVTFPV